MASVVPNRGGPQRALAPVSRRSFDDIMKENKSNKLFHAHTGTVDSDYGYPLNKDGEWGNPEKEDSAMEVHHDLKDCKGTDCEFPKMGSQERAHYREAALEYDPGHSKD